MAAYCLSVLYAPHKDNPILQREKLRRRNEETCRAQRLTDLSWHFRSSPRLRPVIGISLCPFSSPHGFCSVASNDPRGNGIHFAILPREHLGSGNQAHLCLPAGEVQPSSELWFTLPKSCPLGWARPLSQIAPILDYLSWPLLSPRFFFSP